MSEPYSASHPFCTLNGPSPKVRLTRRCQAVEQLNLATGDLSSAWHEAPQVAARFLRAPIGLISLIEGESEKVLAAFGLAQFGLTSSLTQFRQLAGADSLAQHVVDSQKTLVLPDIAEYPGLLLSDLVQTYGVQAYAAAPLITSEGCCIGALAVMDTAARSFSQQDIVFLEMAARWAMAEQERQVATGHKASAPSTQDVPGANTDLAHPESSQELNTLIDAVKLRLISQLTQDLRNPLTSVMGMASMLNRQIYGPLTDKQQEYTTIIRDSSQALMTLVDEIIELGSFDHTCHSLVPGPVDIEMLGQQIISAFEQIAERQHQTLQLTVEPGERLWVLDRSKVKQILYHLLFSVSQMAGENTTIRIHASRKEEVLHLSVWMSNPWLGEGLPAAALGLAHLLNSHHQPTIEELWALGNRPGPQPNSGDNPLDSLMPQRNMLGLLLSQHIASLHQGRIAIQGTSDGGYRFVVELPSQALNPHYSPATSAKAGDLDFAS